MDAHDTCEQVQRLVSLGTYSLGISMLAVGHVSIGYLLGKLTARAVQRRPNIPLLMTLAVLPDIDFLVPFLLHRGPLHSLLFQVLAFLPFLIIFRGRSVPYLVALTSHSIVDVLGWESAQLLWPLSSTFFAINQVSQSRIAVIELNLFLLAASLMILERDATRDPSLLTGTLLIPLTALAVPLILGRPQPLPSILVVPHIAMIFLLVLALGTAVIVLFKKLLGAGALPPSPVELASS